MSRITIDIPKETHKRLKPIAAILGKSMREIVIESIEERLYNADFPNKETLKAIKRVEKGKDLIEAVVSLIFIHFARDFAMIFIHFACDFTVIFIHLGCLELRNNLNS